MGRAGQLPIHATPTTNVIPANAMGQASAIRLKWPSPMARLARWRRNACRVSVVMACVVTRHVQDCVKHVRPRKKAADRTGHVAISNTTRILTMNARAERVPARQPVNSTMA